MKSYNCIAKNYLYNHLVNMNAQGKSSKSCPVTSEHQVIKKKSTMKKTFLEDAYSSFISLAGPSIICLKKYHQRKRKLHTLQGLSESLPLTVWKTFGSKVS